MKKIFHLIYFSLLLPSLVFSQKGNPTFPPIGPVDPPMSKFYRDFDGDGYGDPNNFIEQSSFTLTPEGYVSNNNDCDDTNPNATIEQYWYIDRDNDGVGDTYDSGILTCITPTGSSNYVTIKGDCDDYNPLSIDECEKRRVFVDNDGDGYGGSNYIEIPSTDDTPDGYVSNNLDEDDQDASLKNREPLYSIPMPNADIGDLPGNEPIPGNYYIIDASTYYEDLDGDGIGAGPGYTDADGSLPRPDHFVRTYGDVDDNNPNIGQVYVYIDADGDGYGDKNATYRFDKKKLLMPESFVNHLQPKRNNDPYSYTRYRRSSSNEYGIGPVIFDPNPEEGERLYGYKIPEGYAANNLDCDDDDASVHNGCLELSYNKNFIYTKNYVTPLEDANTAQEGDYMATIDYFDGLGRKAQHNQIKASPTGNDIISFITYDDIGRPHKEYLSYPSTNTPSAGAFDKFSETQANEFYLAHHEDDLDYTAPNPFSENIYENSPLNRIIKKAAPGKSWKKDSGHEIKISYSSNQTSIKKFQVQLDSEYQPSLVLSGNYTPGKLYRNTTINENYVEGQTTTDFSENIEYTNKEGKLLLKRTKVKEASAILNYDTYYVYDDYGNLTYVLPPEASKLSNITQSILNKWCYQYRYDGQDRLIEKKLPGKGKEYLLYNQLDQPVLVQDANLRANNKWLFTKYDVFGRVVYTGLITSSLSRDQLQSQIESVPQFESFSSNYTSINNQHIYYDNAAFPTGTVNQLHSVNYYDSYNFDLNGVAIPSSTIYGQEIVTGNQVNNLLTVERKRVLGTNQWEQVTYGYDTKGRLIWQHRLNPYQELAITTHSQLNFTGNVLASKKTISKGNDPDVEIQDFYTYDHAYRLLKQEHKIGAQDTEVIVENTYNEIGQLITKNLGEGLQNIDYKYNIRGWLTDINDLNNPSNDLFKYQVSYNQPIHAQALFNGNISEINWDSQSIKATNNPKSTRYVYEYDPLNRLTKATDNTGNYSVDLLDYDLNGNITRLRRKGAINSAATNFGVMDNLFYSYTGNQLLRVSDYGNDNYGFKEENTTGNDYDYDDNGNLTKDKNKNIDYIRYNHLNLPTNIFSDATHKIKYTYTADGKKLEKEVTDNTNTPVTQYIDGMVYKDGDLEYIFHPEGYAQPNSATGGYDYVYQLKDHLGNIRLSFTDKNNNGRVAASNVFFENFETASGWDSEGGPTSVNNTVDTYDTQDPKAGFFAAKINAPTSGNLKIVHSNEWIRKPFYVSTERYRVSGWVKTSALNKARVILYKYDFVSSIPGGLGYSTIRTNSTETSTNGQWEYIEFMVNISNSTREFKLGIANNTESGTGEAWFDNLQIEKLNDIETEIVEENNYYPFGLEHKGYNNAPLNEYNYKQYQGQEFTQDLGLNIHEWRYRVSDPSIGRFWQIDPLAEIYVDWAPYVFSGNRITDARELEGLEPISIHTQSFIPYKTLGPTGEGGSYSGDNRGFGQAGKSRMIATVNLNLSGKGITMTGKAASGADTYDSDGNIITHSEASFERAPTIGNNNFSDGTSAATDLEFHISGNNDAIPSSPDIDVKGAFGIGIIDNQDGSSVAIISGEIFGDKFPANETFITDQTGTRIFLGVSGAEGSPLTSLPGNNNREMSTFTISINFDSNGNATGVNYNDTSYSIEDWNKQFTSQNAASNVSTNY